jgi:hypothetical protein
MTAEVIYEGFTATEWRVLSLALEIAIHNIDPSAPTTKGIMEQLLGRLREKGYAVSEVGL